VVLLRGAETHLRSVQGRQLADVGNARYICDQLAFYGQGRNCGIDRWPRDHHQNYVVLSARTHLGRHSVGPALPLMLGYPLQQAFALVTSKADTGMLQQRLPHL
jgi:hypothetical protein